MPAGEEPAPLRLGYRVDDGVVIVDIDGQVDVYSCGLLRDNLLALVGQGHNNLVVNLAKVSFMDSTGLGVLVRVWKQLHPSDGVLALAEPSGRFRRLFDAAGLAKAFSVYESEAEAAQACRRGGPPTTTATSS